MKNFDETAKEIMLEAEEQFPHIDLDSLYQACVLTKKEYLIPALKKHQDEVEKFSDFDLFWLIFTCNEGKEVRSLGTQVELEQSDSVEVKIVGSMLGYHKGITQICHLSNAEYISLRPIYKCIYQYCRAWMILTDDPKEACTHFKSYIRLTIELGLANPLSRYTNTLSARLALKMGDFSGAIQIAEKMGKGFPKNAIRYSGQLFGLEAYLALGKYIEVVAKDKIVDSKCKPRKTDSATKAHLHYLRARAFVGMGLFDKARMEINIALSAATSKTSERIWVAVFASSLAALEGRLSEALDLAYIADACAFDRHDEAVAWLNRCKIGLILDLDKPETYIKLLGTCNKDFTELSDTPWRVRSAFWQAVAHHDARNYATAKGILDSIVKTCCVFGAPYLVYEELKFCKAAFRKFVRADHETLIVADKAVAVKSLGQMQLLARGERVKVKYTKSVAIICYLLDNGPSRAEEITMGVCGVKSEQERRYFHNAKSELNKLNTGIRIVKRPKSLVYEIESDYPIYWDVFEIEKKGLPKDAFFLSELEPTPWINGVDARLEPYRQQYLTDTQH